MPWCAPRHLALVPGCHDASLATLAALAKQTAELIDPRFSPKGEEVFHDDKAPPKKKQVPVLCFKTTKFIVMPNCSHLQ